MAKRNTPANKQPASTVPVEHLVRLRCDQCGSDVVHVDGVTAIWSRGYWWCVKHCRFFFVDGVPVVAFPSEGKLIPDTIVTICDCQKT